MKKSLQYRKEKLDSLPEVSYSAAQSYALGRRDHLSSLFYNCRHAMDRALNWTRLNIGERAHHAVQLVKHALRRRGHDVKITIAKKDSRAPNALGSCSMDGKEITIYEKALQGSHDELLNVTEHAGTHPEQTIAASTTLSRNTVEECCDNYIMPGELPREDRKYYNEINKMEKEAFISGETVSEGFTEMLREKQKRRISLYENYYQYGKTA